MNRYYIPCQGKKPVALEINGHRLLLLSRDRQLVEEHLDDVGADSVKVVKVADTEVAEAELFSKLSKKNEAGVVIIPSEASYSELRSSLETQLPWIQ